MLDKCATQNNQTNILNGSMLRAWIIWLVAATFCFFQFLLQSSTSVMVPQLEHAFNISAEGVGFLSSSFFYTYIVLQIPGGMLTDRFGARKLIIYGLIGLSVFSLVFAFAHNSLVAVLARFGMGIVSAPAVACIMSLACFWFPPEKFALIAGLTEAFGMLGGALGESALAGAVEHVGWRATMLLCALLGVALAILAWLIVFDRVNVATKEKAALSIKQQLFEVLKLPQAWIAGTFSGLIFAVISAFAALWCVTYLEARYGISLEKAAIGSSLIFIGTVVGTPILGYLSDLLKSRKKVMFLGAIGAFVCMLILLYCDIPLLLMFILLFLLGLFCGSYVICFAVVGDLTSQAVRGTAMGFTNMLCIMIGSLILQPLIGYLLEKNWNGQFSNNNPIFSFQDYTIALSTLPICISLAIILLIWLREGKSINPT